jgi:hypothetical protein
MAARSLLVLAIAWVAVAGCNRNMEPYVPGEEPQQPDLSKIFPAGAERTATAGMPGAGPRRATGAAPDDGSGDPIRGRIEISEELSGRLPTGAVLFVIARPGEAGPPMAVKRIVSPRFPLDFEIGPGDRMTETIPFVGSLQLTAWVDADGNATTHEPGDLRGRIPEAVSPGARGVALTIDEIL